MEDKLLRSVRHVKVAPVSAYLLTANNANVTFNACPDLGVDKIPSDVGRRQVKIDDERKSSNRDSDNTSQGVSTHR